MNISIHHLRIYRSVVESQSFLKTAQKNWVSQPTISFYIKSLEEHFGAKLVNWDRSKRTILLTDTGKLVYDAVCAIDAEFSRLESALRSNDTIKDTITIGATATPANYLLPPLIRDFISLNPGIKVIISVNNSEQIYHDLKNESIDFGFCTLRSVFGCKDIDNGDFEVIGTRDEQVLVAICGQHNVLNDKFEILSREQLRGLPLIIPTFSTPAGSSIIEQLKHYDIIPQISLEISNPETTKHYLRIHQSAALLTAISITHEVAIMDITLFGIRDVPLIQRFAFIHKKNRRLSDAKRRFVSHVSNVLSDLNDSSIATKPE
jgi:DNA-binding transcriptional LysR family regulator